MVKKLTLLLESGCRPTTFFINDEDDKLCLEHFRKDMETLNIAEMPVDSSTVLFVSSIIGLIANFATFYGYVSIMVGIIDFCVFTNKIALDKKISQGTDFGDYIDYF